MPETGFEWSTWRKSSLSVAGGCLEVRYRNGLIQVRDSKDPDGAVLAFTRYEWTSFVGGVGLGEFDLPDDI